MHDRYQENSYACIAGKPLAFEHFFPHHACSTVAGLDQKPAGLLSIYTSWPHVHEWHPASYMHAMRASWVPHVLQALHFFSFFTFFLRLHAWYFKFVYFNHEILHDKPEHMHKANIYIYLGTSLSHRPPSHPQTWHRHGLSWFFSPSSLWVSLHVPLPFFPFLLLFQGPSKPLVSHIYSIEKLFRTMCTVSPNCI